MKKILSTFLVLITVLPLLAINPNKLYVQGIMAQDPAKKLQLLEQWLSLFGNEKKQADKLQFVYLGLYDASLRLRRCDKIEVYGVKAIKYARTDLDKPAIYSRMADCYRKEKNLNEAIKNFDASIGFLRKILANPPKNLRISKYKILLADDLRLKGVCLFNLNKPEEGVKSMEESANIYSQFGAEGKKRAKTLIEFILQEGNLYFKKGDFKTANEIICHLAPRLDTYDVYVLCAITFEKLGQGKEKTIPLYIKAYNKQKNGAIAYKLGSYYLRQCLGADKKSIKDPKKADLAMNYFADTVVLLEGKTEVKKLYDSAYKYLKWIYKVKYLKAKEKPTLDSILADARERVGK